MGNGPSLSSDIPGIIKRRPEVRVCAVNYFANNELFVQLRPDFYFLADPIFWNDQDIGMSIKKATIVN